MTKEEFFAELATIDGWELDGQCVRKNHRDPQGKVVHCDCPVTAVANKKAGHVEYVSVALAALYLGLDKGTAHGVMRAADDWPNASISRLEVLAACKLEETVA